MRLIGYCAMSQLWPIMGRERASPDSALPGDDRHRSVDASADAARVDSVDEIDGVGLRPVEHDRSRVFSFVLNGRLYSQLPNISN